MLAGFRVKKIHPVRSNNTSVFLLLLFYPFIFFTSFYSFRKAMRKKNKEKDPLKTQEYREVSKLMRNRKILIDNYLFVEFEKVSEPEDIKDNLRSRFQSFNITT